MQVDQVCRRFGRRAIPSGAGQTQVVQAADRQLNTSIVPVSEGTRRFWPWNEIEPVCKFLVDFCRVFW